MSCWWAASSTNFRLWRQEIAEDGGNVSTHVCDIRQEDAVRAMVAAVLAAQGHIDALVNNAGGQFMTPLEAISAKGWEAVVNTNLTGGFLVARECFTQCMARRGGAIVNIVADMWGSMPGMGHSGAARAGMVSFTETAAVEWGPRGVRVNAVAPGYVASSGMDNYPEAMAPMIREMAKTLPIGRFSTEAEVSAGIVYLLSPAASFVNGTTLRIDAGRPQVRLGWPMRPADDKIRERAAIRPFEGFHRATAPKLFGEPKN
jgi:citronellol/citronellal dehydrogenase